MKNKQAVASWGDVARLPVKGHSAPKNTQGYITSASSLGNFFPVNIDSFAIPTFIVDVLENNRFAIVAINSAHEEVSGLSRRQVANKPLEELMSEELAAKLSRNYMTCVATKKPYSYEERLELPSGGHYWRTMLSPQLDPNGEVVRIYGQAHDITAEKQTYMKEMEKFSALREKLTDFQDTFMSAAHDLRSPLCQLDSLMKLLQMRLEKNGNKEELDLIALSEKLISSSICHLDDVLGKIDVAHVNQSAMDCFDLGRVFSDICLMLDPLQKTLIEYDAPRLIADRTLVHTALFNLIDNALKHNRSKPDLQVRITVTQQPNGMLEFIVADNGKGMSKIQMNPANVSRNKEPGEKPGGFGLYSIRRIVAANSGTFELSSPGEGLVVKFTLPGQIHEDEQESDTIGEYCPAQVKP